MLHKILTFKIHVLFYSIQILGLDLILINLKNQLSLQFQFNTIQVQKFSKKLKNKYITPIASIRLHLTHFAKNFILSNLLFVFDF